MSYWESVLIDGIMHVKKIDGKTTFKYMKDLSINELIDLIAATRPEHDYANNQVVFGSDDAEKLYTAATEELAKRLK